MTIFSGDLTARLVCMSSYRLFLRLKSRRIRKLQRAALGCLLMLLAGLAQTGPWHQIPAMGQDNGFAPAAVICAGLHVAYFPNDMDPDDKNGAQVIPLCPLCGTAPSLDVPRPTLPAFGPGDWVFSTILPRKDFSMPGRREISILPLQPRAPPATV